MCIRDRTINAGTLPRGALAHGPEGLKEALSTFEKARREDLVNERLPPKLTEVEKQRSDYYKRMVKEKNRR